MREKYLAVLMTICVMTAVFVGCGNTENVDTASVEESVSEESDDVSDEEYTAEDENEAVQATLTYMGGLYVNHDPENDMELAIFRNEDGDVVYIIYELGTYEYGMYTTEDAKTDDGRDYEKIIVNEEKSFGYYFDEDLTTGILIGADGKVRDALELDESVARDLVRTTIVGE